MPLALDHQGSPQASVFEHSGPRPAKEERASEQENAWSPLIMSEKKKKPLQVSMGLSLSSSSSEQGHTALSSPDNFSPPATCGN